MLRNYHHLITVSESTRDDLIRLFQVPVEKITVTHHGADLNFGRSTTPRPFPVCSGSMDWAGRFILFLGTLEPRKNLRPLLRAFAPLKERVPHSLVLVGQKGWKWEGILEAIKTLGLEERVRWTGDGVR